MYECCTDVFNQMNHEQEYPPNESKICSWCILTRRTPSKTIRGSLIASQTLYFVKLGPWNLQHKQNKPEVLCTDFKYLQKNQT